MADLRHRCQYVDEERCPRNRNGASRWCDAHGLSGEASAVLRVLSDHGRASAMSRYHVHEVLAGHGFRRPMRNINAALAALVDRGLAITDGCGYYRRTKLQPIVRDMPAIFWRRDGRIVRVGTSDWLESQPRHRPALTVWHAPAPPRLPLVETVAVELP